MGKMLSLEDFAVIAPGAHALVSGVRDVAQEKDFFDKGYRAGWDDAYREAGDADTAARSDISSALQDIDFTYFEARHHVMASFRPVLDVILDTVLPDAAQQSLIPIVQEEVQALAQKIEEPIKVMCAPSAATQLKTAVGASSKSPMQVQVSDTLSGSQIQLQYNDGFSTLDADDTVARIKAAVTNFFAPNTMETAENG